MIVRIPRQAEIAIYERVGDKKDRKAQVVESRPYLVMDKDCRFQAVRLHGSLFGKKTDDLTFSALGGLASYSSERTSGAADLAQTLGKLPETVTSGLEQSGKMLDQVSGLRGRTLKEQIATLQAQIELKKAQIDLGGLEATEGRAAELALLQQQLAFALAQYNIANPGGS